MCVSCEVTPVTFTVRHTSPLYFWVRPTGDLLEESQSEALKLRKRVEELVRDNEALKSSTSSFASACIANPVHTDTQGKSTLE